MTIESRKLVVSSSKASPPKECSSVNTFRGVTEILEDARPRAFLLENVDSLEASPNGSEKDKDKDVGAEPFVRKSASAGT